jgi:hypothetical protein
MAEEFVEHGVAPYAQSAPGRVNGPQAMRGTAAAWLRGQFPDLHFTGNQIQRGANMPCSLDAAPEWRIVAVRHRADRLIKHDVVGQGVRASRAVSALAVLEIHPKARLRARPGRAPMSSRDWSRRFDMPLEVLC